MTDLYAVGEPHAHGRLDAGDGHSLHWEEVGNPDGKPAVVLHGGPGSGCIPAFRRYFDPARYRVVLFDQRQCGRSTPHASDPATDLSTNTTARLIHDIEALRIDRGIDRWLVWGISWGCTLGVAYAEAHPERASELVLWSPTLTRRADIEWLYGGVSAFFPEEFARFRSEVPAAERDGDLVEAYRRMLASGDAAVRERAARRWCEWEDVVAAGDTGRRGNPRYRDPSFRMAFARIVTHYFANGAWLDDDQLVRDAGRLVGIPGALVAGRLDLGGPPAAAWALAQAWPDADLHLVEGTGHGGNKKTVAALLEATDRFAAG